MEGTKQVIVMRKFPSMRTGKYCAQASHASMSFLTRRITGADVAITLSDEETLWLKNSFRKIVCYVESDEALVGIYHKALQAGLKAFIVEDNGTTEFGGVTTRTAVAIGPHYDSKFVGVTDKLPLF